MNTVGVISPFFFVNSHGKKEGNHYTLAILERIWNRAAKRAGVSITLYQGTKHTSCDIFLNEKGGTIAELESKYNESKNEINRVLTEFHIMLI